MAVAGIMVGEILIVSMSLAHVQSACLRGYHAVPVTVEVDIQPGLPYFSIIGLVDRQIGEAKERVRSAIKNSGYPFPLGKVTVNLVPAHISKAGTCMDLAIAIGILLASHIVQSNNADEYVLGELSLSGAVVATESILGILSEMKQGTALIPLDNMSEAALTGIPVRLAGSLKEALTSRDKAKVYEVSDPGNEQNDRESFEIDGIYGQTAAKRCLEISLAGNHHLLLSGPPGTAKTALVQSAIQLLPRLSLSESVEVSRIFAMLGLRYDLVGRRPPSIISDTGITRAGMIGGGNPVSPGTFSVANRGIIFLDELPFLKREVKDSILQPMQEQEVRLSRKGESHIFPASSLVIGTMNPCPCGKDGENGEGCTCSEMDKRRYAGSLSAALLDRFQLFFDMPRIDAGEWQKNSLTRQSGKEMARRISEARSRQYQRYGVGKTNGFVSSDELGKHSDLDPETRLYLEKAGDKFGLSGRGIKSVISVARTITDLEVDSDIALAHIQEALQYRKRR